MNGYICIYKGQRHELYAESMLEAQTKGAEHFKVKQAWKVTTVLAEKDGEQVTHAPLF